MLYLLFTYIPLECTTHLLLGMDLPVGYLLDTSILLVCCIVAMLLYIGFYLWNYMVTGRKKKQLEHIFQELISEVVIAEDTDELEAIIEGVATKALLSKTLRRRLGRYVFTSELLKIRKGMSGKAVENIRWLYYKLYLHQDSLANLANHRWYIKATAIQELAMLGAESSIGLITELTNHRNFHIRNEAQMALVKMTGFKGLAFLHSIQHPLTQWQQICLLQQLSMEADVEAEQVAQWLGSDNETVVELSLKIIGAFKLHTLYPNVLMLWKHASPLLRQQAANTLIAIGEEVPAHLAELQSAHPS